MASPFSMAADVAPNHLQKERWKVAFRSMFLMGTKSQRFGASSFSKFYYTLQKKPFATPRNNLYRAKKSLCDKSQFAHLFYYTDLSRFVPSVSIEYLTICWICPDSRISQDGFKTKKLRKRANLTGKSRCSSKEP